jgi:hypothetical protein
MMIKAFKVCDRDRGGRFTGDCHNESVVSCADYGRRKHSQGAGDD